MRHSIVLLFYCSIVLCFLLPPAFSQPYWNEWINYSQKYYKIPVSQNGIYRLNYQILSGAGIPVSTIDPRNFQLFFRGEEQYIYVKGESDSSFDASDYIEFYGQKNDGTLDSLLYKGDLYNKTARQPNPYYSLFNDTSSYFLTWNSSLSNRRIIDSSDTNYSSFSPNDYFMKEDRAVNYSNYFYGKCWQTSTDCVFVPEYDETEGWSGPDFGIGCYGCLPSYSQTINTSNTFTAAATNAELKIAVMGASDDSQVTNDHPFQLKYKNASGNFIIFLTDINSIAGYQLFDLTAGFPVSVFGSSTEFMVSALACSCATNRLTVPYIVFKYPHNLNLENQSYYEMLVPDAASQNKSYFTFTNFNDLSVVTYLYDFVNHLKIPATKTGNTFQVLVPNASAEKFCALKSENQFLTPASVNPVNGTGSFTDYSSLAADSAFIIITHKSLMTGVASYASYRQSINGGSHNVLLADIDELYEQFAFGIPKNPFAIRNFSEYCADNFPTVPKNLFLIGKSIQTDLIRNQYSDPTGNNYASSLVPTLGFPSCDNMLVSALNGNLLQPVIPMGRLAAKSNSEVDTYRNKVDEFEHPTPNPDEWMKHIIHMGGGADSQQQALLCYYYLQGYENIIEDTCFGGFVHAFCKNSSSPTQTPYTDSIKGLIKDGISLLTFFGHGSASVLDFNILPPEEYENDSGKYPFFTALGCSFGNIHQPVSLGLSGSETYVLHERGMIATWAMAGAGTPTELNSIETAMYNNIGHYLYGKSAGSCIQKSIADVQQPTSIWSTNVMLGMTLHGDPSLVIHSPALPDYAVKNSSVYFTPSYVSTDMDSFDMNIIITNIGRATGAEVRVDVTRIFPDGTQEQYSDTIPFIYFKDTFTLRLPVDPNKGPGLNKFEVRVDMLNTVDEIDNYVNNNLVAPYEIPLMIYSGDIIPVYPYKYAIVPNNTVNLKAYTANPFASTARYVFEIDTTDLFNSPLKKTQYVTQRGAVVKAPYNLWPSPLFLSDNMVYFWRVRRDTSDFTNFRWRESSFQYIPQKRGWGQSHFFQFLKGDKYKYIDTVRTKRYFDLDFYSRTLEARSRNLSASGLCGQFSIDVFTLAACSFLSVYFPGQRPHVVVALIDTITGNTITNYGTGQYGSYIPFLSFVSAVFEFETSTSAQQDSLRKFLQDILPCGAKFALYINDNHNLGDIIGNNGLNVNPGLVQAFQSVGAVQFPNLQNNVPYILMGRKCGAVAEVIGNSPTDDISLFDTITVRRISGTIFSETIGPASAWKSLHWNYHSPEEGINDAWAAYDTINITIIGIKSDGTADTLIENLPQTFLDTMLGLSISADIYPYLKLQAWVKDSLRRTPAQLRFWRIYYDGVPDAALNPSKYFSFYDTVVQQGDSIKFSVAIENIGDYDMDSLWVGYWIQDINRNKILPVSVKMAPLPVNQFLIGSVKFPALNIPGGLNSLWIEANPFNTEHQLEQYHFNNIGTLAIQVNADNINPLLDVTFDGVHIMNGDIVSAKPVIVIGLKDENTFLALDDTSKFTVQLKKPSQANFESIPWGSEMTFEKAVLPDNSCKITYSPTLSDGIHTLRVQAKDRSGNLSGSNAYSISFEVITKPSITYLLNYPNPFSTSTRFVFTLTGSKVPDYLKIQILTITGKIVKELNKDDMGPLHIGRNITEYAWDGKDDFGDQLANGIYLYRVLTQLDGIPLEHRETSADDYFIKGYGKMYLIR